MDKAEKVTHVAVSEDFTEPTGSKPLNGDGIGYVESYDFSKANMSAESRIAAVSAVASVCYQNPKALGSVSLYDRLATENKGLPSSSYEFVPVLINFNSLWVAEKDRFFRKEHIDQFRKYMSLRFSNCIKYGEFVEDTYLLTNLRALIADVGDDADQFYNTEEECKIIAKHFKVYKTKIDLSTARQFMRHRCSWQELSRRYVSGNKSPFEFYISDKMRDVVSHVEYMSTENGDDSVDTEDLISFCVDHYDKAIANGVKPEEARRILPQAMYTTVWSAWQPNQLDILYKLRIDKHAQKEIQDLALAMQALEGES
jgi:thymidylate synthase (FAD)